MIILGIDPGSARIGYGLIEKSGSSLSLINCGTIQNRTSADQIKENAKAVSQLIKKYRPELVAIEKIYFSKNVKTGIAVAQNRGALLLEVSKHQLPIKEVSPSEVKLSVTGYGLADKKTVAKMVAIILKLEPDYLKEYDDATDALAIAIFGSNTNIKGC